MTVVELFDPIISLSTLTLMEIVLSVDNMIFLVLISHQVERPLRARAQRLGIFFSVFTRLLFLAAANQLAALSGTVFSIDTHHFSWRDVILGGGGIFLWYKASSEIYNLIEKQAPTPLHTPHKTLKKKTLTMTVLDMMLIDIAFSADSVFTAVGMTQQYTIMATAIVLSTFVMLAASHIINRLIEKHPSLKNLALGFVLMIGTMLVADSLGNPIPKAYINAAIVFCLLVVLWQINIRRHTDSDS